jgi:hypothetical protein
MVTKFLRLGGKFIIGGYEKTLNIDKSEQMGWLPLLKTVHYKISLKGMKVSYMNHLSGREIHD